MFLQLGGVLGATLSTLSTLLKPLYILGNQHIMDDKLIKDMIEVADMRTQLQRCFTTTSIPPQMCAWFRTLDRGLTFIQRAQGLKLAKLCSQTTVNNRTVENIAFDGMPLIMETVFELQPQLRELHDSDAKECNRICIWFLQNTLCIHDRLVLA